MEQGAFAIIPPLPSCLNTRTAAYYSNIEILSFTKFANIEF